MGSTTQTTLRHLKESICRVMPAVVGITLLFAATGCGPIGQLTGLRRAHQDAGNGRYVMNCGPSDQRLSYMNPINARKVVKVHYDARFTQEEKHDIADAMAEWNSFSKDSRSGRMLFEAEEETSVSANSIPARKGDCDFATSSDGYAIILTEDTAQWEAMGLTPNNPAVTVRCSRSQEFVAKQVIIVNTKYARAAGDKFKTIIKHEMGHSLGLDHSCDMNGSHGSGFVACSRVNPVDYADYYEAVMFPEIHATEPVSGRFSTLNNNDRERAECILGVSG